MNQPRPGARPPRFLFSFSTPPAPGAARLHRGGFPGTLPLTPLAVLAAAWPLLSSLTRSLPTAKARLRPPPPPSPQPRSRQPGRLAGASPGAARRRLALKRSREGADASAAVCGADAGLREGSGPKPGVERLLPRVAPAAGLRRTWRARAGAHLPHRDPARPSRSPRLSQLQCLPPFPPTGSLL